MDLCYWFRKSSKRKSILKEYNEFCDQEYADIVEHASTRWLSLEKCVARELEKFEGIKSYFLSEKFPDARFKRLRKSFESPMTSVYLRFYQCVLTAFNNLNKLLQSEDPLITMGFKLTMQTAGRFQVWTFPKPTKKKIVSSRSGC